MSKNICPARQEFETEVLRNKEWLLLLARRYTRNQNDAEDLVQETCLRAIAAFEQFIPGKRCRPWLSRILYNTFATHYRRVAHNYALASAGEFSCLNFYSEEAQREAQRPEEHWLDLMLSDEVLEALEELPEEFRLVIEMYALDGLSYKEISQQLSCPMGTVMSRLFRGRKLLSTQLERYAHSVGVLKNSRPLTAQPAAPAKSRNCLPAAA